MPQYEPMQRIIALSLEELNEIIRHLHEKNDDIKNSNTVLIGGWAVDSYNSWFGSIDIDLITSSRIRKSIMYHLRENRDFKPYRLPGISTSVQKMTDFFFRFKASYICFKTGILENIFVKPSGGLLLLSETIEYNLSDENTKGLRFSDLSFCTNLKLFMFSTTNKCLISRSVERT
ncbi:hypothetical protein Mpsy_3079 [Methanolobus psychrophilus R15]|nr:hypothetical protein Mpsy_3079 [Methanolobus psychrophilus R15]